MSMINPLGFIGSVAGVGGPAASVGTAASGGAAAGSGASFASVLAGAASSTVNSIEHAQQVSIQALQGKADTREVVDAVMNAQDRLSAAIAIRDKIVSAYLDISRMAI
jgi:flagellar hook-basal body complex protein FliE